MILVDSSSASAASTEVFIVHRHNPTSERQDERDVRPRGVVRAAGISQKWANGRLHRRSCGNMAKSERKYSVLLSGAFPSFLIMEGPDH